MRLISIFGFLFLGIISQAQDNISFTLDGKSIPMFESKKKIERLLNMPDSTIAHYFGDEYKLSKYRPHIKSYYTDLGLTYIFNGNGPNYDAKDIEKVEIDGNTKININNIPVNSLDTNNINTLFTPKVIYLVTSGYSQIGYTHRYSSKRFIYLIYCDFDESGKLNQLTISARKKRVRGIKKLK
jgi:hypothetical protein